MNGWDRHRDWRIDTAVPSRSLVFVKGKDGRYAYPKNIDSYPAEDAGFDVLGTMAALAATIKSTAASTSECSFAIVHEGIRFRAERVTENWYALRNTAFLRDLKELGMSMQARGALLAPELNSGGLVVVCGDYGVGKTTTINATIVQRLAIFGGFATVFARPIEYEIGGFHGEAPMQGYCEHIDLTDRDMLGAIRMSMRNFPVATPSILSFPEVIGGEAVGELLQAANRGNLVFCDMHAVNPIAALLNLVSLAEREGERYARELLGNAMRLLVHQRMKRYDRVDYQVVEFKGTLLAALRNTELPIPRLQEHLTDSLAWTN